MTAIEQLMEDLDSFIFGDLKLTTKDIWNKALKNEKRQIMEAWLTAKPITFNGWKNEFEKYYNEKFKK